MRANILTVGVLDWGPLIRVAAPETRSAEIGDAKKKTRYEQIMWRSTRGLRVPRDADIWTLKKVEAVYRTTCRKESTVVEI
jgi:hypothetical protein